MTVVFVNPSGQRDNLGDSVLRRAYLDHLRGLGPLHVYVGNDTSYISGLGVQSGDTAYESKSAWYRALVGHSRSGPVVFALNAGEIVLDRRYFTNAGWQSLAMLLAKLSGGYSVALGISIRPAPLTSLWALKPLLGRCRSVVWRDAASQRLIGRGEVAADWAFALPSEGGSRASAAPGAPAAPAATGSPAARATLAVSMRGDRGMPPEQWFDAVTTLAAELECRIVVVVQVQRDGPLARELAGRLGGELLDWTSASHREHELVVRTTYSQSRAVVSDRIHSLIIGMTEGAAPVGVASASSEKLTRTFAGITDRAVAFSARDFADGPALAEAMRAAVVPTSVLVDEVDRAKVELLRLL